jgi:hypothetical protein
MVVSYKYCVLSAFLLLAACGKGAEPAAEATPPAAATNMPEPAVTPPASVEPTPVAAPGSIAPAESNNKQFKASVTSELEPVVINQLHSWTLHVQSADGAPVEDATITVTGSMPAHSHGMPTNPQVTANLGGGNYKIEGLQFQMGGDWEVVFTITSGAVSDVVSFRFNLR